MAHHRVGPLRDHDLDPDGVLEKGIAMKPVPLLQQIVVQLARRYDVDWQRTGVYLRLRLEGHGHLVVENIGAHRLSLTNYIPVGYDLVADPEVVLYTDYHPHGVSAAVWAPMEITQLFSGWHLHAEIDLQGNLLVHDLVGQVELATFCEQILARNLARDGWLVSAVRVNQARHAWTLEEIYARDIRLDDMWV